MKNTATLSLALLLTHFAQAQTEPGRALWSGNLQINTTQLAGDYPNGYTRRSPQLSLSVHHGVFLPNNWLTGLAVRGSYYKQVTASTIPLDQNYWQGGLDVFVRKYWGASNWRIFAGGGIGGSIDQLRQDVYDAGTSIRSENRTNSYQVAPFTQIGGLYFLNSRWGLELATSSTVFPFTFSGLTAGLVYLTGSTASARKIQEATPPTAGSQTRAGRFTAGASIVFSSQNNEGNTQTASAQSLTAAPAVGFFVANNLLVGISVPITWNKADGPSKTTETILGLAPYVRAYLSSTRLRPYAGVTATYSTYSFKQDPYPRERISHTVGAALTGGLAYLLGRNFIAEANLLNLTVSKQTQHNQLKNGLWLEGLQLTTSPTFSVQYVF